MTTNNNHSVTTEDGPNEVDPVSVPLCDIVRDETLQVRNTLSRSAISKYRDTYRAGGKLPPIQLARISGALYVTDGWHRIEAAQLLGRETLQAVVTDQTREEAIWAAASANLKHGVPLKSREYRAVFGAYIRSGQHRLPRNRLKSYREMAADLNGVCHFTTLRNWLRTDFPNVFHRMGGDEGHETGGPTDRNQYDATPPETAAAIQHLEQFLAIARGCALEERERLQGALERAAGEFRELQAWTPGTASEPSGLLSDDDGPPQF